PRLSPRADREHRTARGDGTRLPRRLLPRRPPRVLLVPPHTPGDGAHHAPAARDRPAAPPRPRRRALAAGGARQRTVGRAVPQRRVRFHESEWALPAERVEEAFAALRERFEAEGVRVTFPLEIRRAAADDVWLSTAHGRDTVYIAAHRHHTEEAGPYLLLVQR